MEHSLLMILSRNGRVNKTRMEKKKYDRGEQSSLNDIRLHHLNNVGFNWGENKGDAKWEEHFHNLQQYVLDYGNSNVPTKFAPNTALGRWVSTRTYKVIPCLCSISKAQQLYSCFYFRTFRVQAISGWSEHLD